MVFQCVYSISLFEFASHEHYYFLNFDEECSDQTKCEVWQKYIPNFKIDPNTCLNYYIINFEGFADIGQYDKLRV